jgi:hypothetical protein
MTPNNAHKSSSSSPQNGPDRKAARPETEGKPVFTRPRTSHKESGDVARDGFPRGYFSPKKRHHGFQTGDLVRAAVPSGKRKGSYTGRVAVRETGSFNIQTGCGTVQGIAHRFCRLIQPADGYAYGATKPRPRGLLPALKDGASAASFR